MTTGGYVVLHRLTDLELIVACWPAATLANTCRAHWPEVRSRDQALIRAAQAFGEVRGELVLSWGEAQQRLREIATKRRAKSAAQRHHHRRSA